LRQKAHLSTAEIENLMERYKSNGIVDNYAQVTCPCGVNYDSSEESCGECGRPVTDASPNGVRCYRILVQPTAPAYDPASQPVTPKDFISYRHSDCSVLAADIYYSLVAEGHLVFLDDDSIPVGADSEQIYLRAASNAEYFIALVSGNYFQSGFCKKEIAHAARCQRRLIRVNVPPVPSAPSDMPWIDSPNWNKQQGSPSGLATALEQSLLSAVQIQPSAATIADLRKEACQFLMSQLSPSELIGLWNRLLWMNDLTPAGSKQENIRLILQETTAQRLPVLCNALAP